MVENPSPVPDFITSPELEEGIKNGRITTFTITEKSLPYYQQAASMTNFEVTVIAEKGQYYITEQSNSVKRGLKAKNVQENKTPTITPIKSQLPVGKGYVAISLKRPEGFISDTAFHAVRQRIQPP